MEGNWHPDPTGRHELRYWDGSAWTAAVSDAGQQTDDPPTWPVPPKPSGLGLRSGYLRYLRRGGGFYIDVGASDLICDGSIKLCHGGIERLTEGTVILDDGTELPADLIVYATGFRSMNSFVADLIGQDVADKVGRGWGLGSGTTQDPGPWEVELRNMWKPTQQENLWFHGGNLHQSRHYSLFLALQLKARCEGIPTPVYGLQQVHHQG